MCKLINKIVFADKFFIFNKDKSLSILEDLSSYIKLILEEETSFFVDVDIIDEGDEVKLNFISSNTYPSPTRNIPFHVFLSDFLGTKFENISFSSNIMLNEYEKERLEKRLKIFFLKVKLVKKQRAG